MIQSWANSDSWWRVICAAILCGVGLGPRRRMPPTKQWQTVADVEAAIAEVERDRWHY